MSCPTYEDAIMEPLPDYKCTLGLVANFLHKAELQDPYQTARHRGWLKVRAELRGTFLILRSINRRSNAATMWTYSLQSGEVGLATDYKRRSFVLRVRVEGYQSLLAAGNLITALEWVDKLEAAIAISAPLDNRREPRCYSIPSPIVDIDAPSVVNGLKRKFMGMWRRSQKEREWLMQAEQYTEEHEDLLISPLEAWVNGHSRPQDQEALEARNAIAPAPLTARASSVGARCPCAECWSSSSRTTSIACTPTIMYMALPCTYSPPDEKL